MWSDHPIERAEFDEIDLERCGKVPDVLDALKRVEALIARGALPSPFAKWRASGSGRGLRYSLYGFNAGLSLFQSLSTERKTATDKLHYAIKYFVTDGMRAVECPNRIVRTHVQKAPTCAGALFLLRKVFPEEFQMLLGQPRNAMQRATGQVQAYIVAERMQDSQLVAANGIRLKLGVFARASGSPRPAPFDVIRELAPARAAARKGQAGRTFVVLRCTVKGRNAAPRMVRADKILK